MGAPDGAPVWHAVESRDEHLLTHAGKPELLDLLGDRLRVFGKPVALPDA
jgi:hypothetical protein